MPVPTIALRWTLTLDPLTTAIGFVHLQAERTLPGGHFSLYGSPSLRLYDGVLPAIAGPYRGLGLEVGVRGFFRSTAPEGAWLMLRGVGAHLHTTEPAERETALGGYASVLGGYTWIGEGGLVLSGGLGVSVFRYEVGDYGIRGPGIAAHTNIGWAF